MIWRALIRLWFWLTEEQKPPKAKPPPYPHGDPPGHSPPGLSPLLRDFDEVKRARERRQRNWGNAVGRARDNRENGLDWPEDD